MSFNVPVILASSSPRRIELLESVGIRCIVKKPEVREVRKKGESAPKMVARLAREKAENVMPSMLREFGAAIIIGADTIVLAPGSGQVLGKPKNATDAKKILKSLSGRTHTVLTGYCILSAARGEPTEVISKVVSTRVKIRTLKDDAITRYVLSGEPMDKAGAYAAQGLGMAFIEKVSGSYTNVVGLPLSHLLFDLEKKFGLPLFERVSPPVGDVP